MEDVSRYLTHKLGRPITPSLGGIRADFGWSGYRVISDMPAAASLAATTTRSRQKSRRSCDAPAP